MHKIGETSAGTILVEMSKSEWGDASVSSRYLYRRLEPNEINRIDEKYPGLHSLLIMGEYLAYNLFYWRFQEQDVGAELPELVNSDVYLRLSQLLAAETGDSLIIGGESPRLPDFRQQFIDNGSFSKAISDLFELISKDYNRLIYGFENDGGK